MSRLTLFLCERKYTCPLNLAHVEALAESIAALGLIEPLVVDKQGRLLTGGHQLAAIVQLRIP